MLPHAVRIALTFALVLCGTAFAEQLPPVVEVEGQPLGANVTRLLNALDILGAPLPKKQTDSLRAAASEPDAGKLQQLLDSHVLALISINPESRVKAVRGPAVAVLQQAGFTPVILKVVNDSTVTKPLRISSPQAGPVHTGGWGRNTSLEKGRFLDVEMFTAQPMLPKLSGLRVEYVLALIHSSEAGKREATLHFDVGEGSQDIGARGQAPILFEIRPAVAVQATCP